MLTYKSLRAYIHVDPCLRGARWSTKHEVTLLQANLLLHVHVVSTHLGVKLTVSKDWVTRFFDDPCIQGSSDRGYSDRGNHFILGYAW